MLKRIVEISGGPTRLSVANRQLVLEKPESERATVPIEDLGVLLVDHPAVSYTHGVFTGLLDAGAAVVLCGGDHHPVGMFLPLSGHREQSERFRHQVDAPLPLKKRMWREIVAAKIAQQGAILEFFSGKDEGLSEFSGRVRSGDPENAEAQAAQRYWPALLGRDFRRDRAGPPPNNLLNYGYMALRAATARALVSAGLLPTLGIHHHNRYNPFCLADDLMEPFRPYIDFRARKFADTTPVPESLDRPAKAAMLGAFNDLIEIEGKRTPLMLALHRAAATLADAFLSGEPVLALPSGLPVPPGAEGDADDDGGKG